MMNRTILWILLLLVLFHQTNGQQRKIAINYNYTNYNAKFGVHYEKSINKKINAIVGLSYRIDDNFYFGYIKPMNIGAPDEMAVFYKFYSKSFFDKFSFRFGLKKSFIISNSLCNWSAFYDAQIGTASFEIIMGGFDSSGAAYAGLPFPYSTQNSPILEQHLGITCSFRISDKLHFTNSFGLGITSLFNSPKNLFRSDVSAAIPGVFNFSYMLNSGLAYDLTMKSRY